jgi:hypothetical protein
VALKVAGSSISLLTVLVGRAISISQPILEDSRSF